MGESLSGLTDPELSFLQLLARERREMRRFKNFKKTALAPEEGAGRRRG